MLNLNEFSHNHHPSRVNLLAKYIRRGIWGVNAFANGIDGGLIHGITKTHLWGTWEIPNWGEWE